MRTAVAMLSVILYAVSYGLYLYMAKNNLLNFAHAGTNFAIKDGMTAYIFTVMTYMSLTCKGTFERAWLQTGILFVSLILFWKVGYNLNLLHELSLNYVIILCFATASISLIFFLSAHRHKLLKE